MKYIIAYDIADPGRLRRVARYFERHALRCQKSVFLADATAAGIAELLDGTLPLMSEKLDSVQAWKLSADQQPDGLVRGAAYPLSPSSVVHVQGENLFVRGD